MEQRQEHQDIIGDHFWSSLWFYNEQHYLSPGHSATCWTPVHFTEEMCSTRIVQHGWNGGCSGQCLPNRWQLMTLCFCRNEKCMRKDIASVFLPCTPRYTLKITHAHAHKFLATTTHTWTNTYTPTHANTHVHFSINSLVNAYIGDGWKHENEKL